MSVMLQTRGDLGEFRKRYKWLALFALLLFMALVGRLFQLQVLEGDDYATMAHDNIIRKANLPSTRGVIRDAYGRILASSRPAYNVYITPGRVLNSLRLLRRKRKNEQPDSFPRIAEILRLTPDERARITRRVTELCAADNERAVPPGPCWRQILIREDVARDIVAELKQHPTDIGGTDIVSAPVRFYPYKNLGSHMLGYVAEIDKERLERYQPEGYTKMSTEERQRVNPLGYRAGDSTGATGLERAWESHLRGQRGWSKRVVDSHGRYRSGPEADSHLDEPVRQDPIAGRDVRLTVDIDLVTAIEKAMRVHLSGAVVVVDVRTGRLIALYSKPDYDPNDVSGGGGKARLREAMTKYARDSLHPMLDKTMTGAFQPGSTFKPFSALAGLERKVINPLAREHCDGYISFGHRRFKCSHVHGDVAMREAIAESCNVYFYKLSQQTDLDPIANMAAEFGLGQKTGLSINPESPGNVPNRSWYTLRYRGQFQRGFILNTSIGQGASTVTPLQLALAYAALANGGTVYMPQIVRALETSEGAVAQEFAPRVRQKANVAPEHLARIVDGLYAVVNDPHGTAYPVRDAALDIAGKTGTAQTGYVMSGRDDPKDAWYYARDHAWFAAFAPAKAPEIAVVVLVEHGGSGPTQAAPVAMQIVRDYTRLKAEHEAAKIDLKKRAH